MNYDGGFEDQYHFLSKIIPIRLTIKIIMREKYWITQDLTGKNHAEVDSFGRSLSSHGLGHWYVIIQISQLVKANKIDKLYGW